MSNPAPRDTPALDDPAKYSPQPGDVGFSTIRARAGWIAMWGQTLIGDACRYDHVFWVVNALGDPQFPDGRIIEAGSPAHRYRPLRPRLRPGHAYATVQLTAEQRERVPQVAHGFMTAHGGRGIDYSWLSYPAMALVHRGWLLPGLRRYISRRGSDGHLIRMICSHTVDEGLRRIGRQLFDDGRWECDVTPGDVFYATDPRVIPPIPAG